MRIYVASSWRNEQQQGVVAELRTAGHEVYDFKNPAPGDNGFHWSEIDGGWKNWNAEVYRKALKHPIAESGFGKDFAAMKWAEAFVLLQPCGRSAHLEAGWAIGAGKPTVILIAERGEPELMYKLAAVCLSLPEVVAWLAEIEKSDRSDYAIVEVMGHRRYGARVAEVQKFGLPFLRADVLTDPPYVQFVQPGSIFALTPCSKAQAEAASQGWAASIPEEIKPRALLLTGVTRDDDAALDADQLEIEDNAF